MTATDVNEQIATSIAAALGDYAKMGVRVRNVTHSLNCKDKAINLHIHYPSLRHGRATVGDLVSVLSDFIVRLALPRRDVERVYEKYGQIPVDDFVATTDALRTEAISLFIKANKNTHRNGEAGELLLYLFTEWFLGAPQLIAKLSLKTNAQMPVYGSDGIHVKYHGKSGVAAFYWGESKLHQSINGAISSAVQSIKTAISKTASDFEFDLILRNIPSAALEPQAEAAILAALDPFDEASNSRKEVITCLVGFDSASYTGQIADEAVFVKSVVDEVEKCLDSFSNQLASNNIQGQEIEVFFFPIPSVVEFRDAFQDTIGWTN